MRKLVGNKYIFESSPVFDTCKATSYERKMCYDSKHLESICKMFPISLLKFVRLPVSLMERLLTELNDPNIHVIFLARDPRAVMSSRWNIQKTRWCKSIDCYSAKLMCNDMDSDLTATYKLRQLFPKQVHFLRYEDVALKPQEMSVKMIDALGIDFSSEISRYLKEHTTSNKMVSKTYRDSQSRVMAWSSEMDYEHMMYVQNNCTNVMERFGYFPTLKREFTLDDVMVPFPGAI